MSGSIDFSIVVPTRDRHPQLTACLEAIAEIEYPRSRFEVIVVDDGSEEPIESVVDGFRERVGIKNHRQLGSGPAAARNAGASLARGRYIVFTDDDCLPAPDWLGQLAARLRSAPDSVVGGRTVNTLAENPYSTASQLLISYLYGYFNPDPDSARFLVSCNLAVPAEKFHSLGGFDTAYTLAAAEDRDFCDRLLLDGHTLRYASDAIVHHGHYLNPASFWRQHFGYGRGARQLRRLHDQRSSDGIRVEPVRFYVGMFLSPFRRRGTKKPLFVSALLFLSQVANAAGYFFGAKLPGEGR